MILKKIFLIVISVSSPDPLLLNTNSNKLLKKNVKMTRKIILIL